VVALCRRGIKGQFHPIAAEPAARYLLGALAHSFQDKKKIGLTFAPEAGTERLRRVINKGFARGCTADNRDCLGTGWRNIKLYFMIGLPTETSADIAGIVDLVHKIRISGIAE